MIERPDLQGRAFCEAWTATADEWLAGLFDRAATAAGADVSGLALVALGGYGRRQLCPQSDLDVMLLHDGCPQLAAVADALWYPVWDAGLKLGHAVRTRKEALRLAADDLDTATSLLDTRLVAGSADLAGGLREAAHEQWRGSAKRWLARLAETTEQRWRRYGEVAFLLEPDLKEGRGGLRDVHALSWADAARSVLLPLDEDTLGRAEGTLVDARVALGRRQSRASDVLLLQEQDGVAADLGLSSADELMRRVAASGRAVAWTADDTWDRVRSSLAGPLGRAVRRDRVVGPGVVLREGRVRLADDVDPAADPATVLRVAAVAAHAGARIERGSLERLADRAPPLEGVWPDSARHELVSLLGAGPAMIPVVETLDHAGLITRILPEWAAVRSKPQRNAYHRFTVDRHLCEAAAEAAALTRTVARPDLLLVGAWLHDIGKGFPGDHTTVGMELVERLARRMGFDDDDVAVLVALVEHHLLLPDVATRRDLDDDDTIDGVAAAIGSPLVLELLVALTEADSKATGPAAWSRWKAGLVDQLAARVAHVLEGGTAGEVTADLPVPAGLAQAAAAGETVVRGDGRRLEVVAADRPGLFGRVAGTLALHGLDVLAAAAWTHDGGMAVETFDVEPVHADEPDWPAVVSDLERVLAGRLSLDARLARRARSYAGLSGTGPEAARRAAEPATPTVSFDNDSTASATVVEVRAPDGVGVLYRITRAFADLDLDIRHAKVQTLGHEVVDTFYLLTADGEKILDADHQREVADAVVHELGR